MSIQKKKTILTAIIWVILIMQVGKIQCDFNSIILENLFYHSLSVSIFIFCAVLANWLIENNDKK